MLPTERSRTGASAVRWSEPLGSGLTAAHARERDPLETRAHACGPRSRQRTALAQAETQEGGGVQRGGAPRA
ncbi:hypothetical protein PLANTIT3_50423 [Plantibacter sp. T3]|nr:hypothetical protein PLANTIT3_50423 [Plantibacter sp. T3]